MFSGEKAGLMLTEQFQHNLTGVTGHNTSDFMAFAAEPNSSDIAMGRHLPHSCSGDLEISGAGLCR